MLGSLGDLARELGRGNEVPDEFLFANALTVAGTIMSGRFCTTSAWSLTPGSIR
jgi:hypothetical protein